MNLGYLFEALFRVTQSIPALWDCWRLWRVPQIWSSGACSSASVWENMPGKPGVPCVTEEGREKGKDFNFCFLCWPNGQETRKWEGIWTQGTLDCVADSWGVLFPLLVGLTTQGAWGVWLALSAKWHKWRVTSSLNFFLHFFLPCSSWKCETGETLCWHHAKWNTNN